MPSFAAATISEAQTLLASPRYATRTPSNRQSRSRIVITSASAWHGCELSVRPLMTGIVAWRAGSSTPSCATGRSIRAAAGGVVLPLAPRLALLEVVREVEDSEQLLAAPVGDAREVPALEALGDDCHQFEKDSSRPACASSSRKRDSPVNMRLLIVPSGWSSRSASCDWVRP